MATSVDTRSRHLAIQGIVLILLAIFTVVQGVAFSLEDRAQQACVEEKFAELSDALEARSKLAERESAANKSVLLSFSRAAGLRRDPDHQPTPAEQAGVREQMIETLLAYEREINKITRARQENPVPPYPVGICNGKR